MKRLLIALLFPAALFGGCTASPTCGLIASIFGDSTSVSGSGSGMCSTGATSGSDAGAAGSGAAGSGSGGATSSGGVGGAGGIVASGGVTASGGVVGSGGQAGTSAGGQAGAAPTTQLGWIPCAAKKETPAEGCTIPSGTVTVLYGDDLPPPFGLSGAHTTTKTFTNAAPTTISCVNATFSSATLPGGNPNPCGSCTNYCWYQGQVPVSAPVGQFTGPQIDLPMMLAPFPGFSSQRVEANSFPVTLHSDVGAFRDPCPFAKFAFTNPLTNANYLYSFFGNTGVTATSTPLSIRTTGASTCAGGTLNRSAYWVPAMIDNVTHQPVRPSFSNIYYKTMGVTPTLIHPVPTGLVMLTGDDDNVVAGVNPVRYSCVSDTGAGAWQASIPACPDSTWSVIAEFSFPQCWDGVNLDSPDHRSHMSDPVGGVCPSHHPIGIPQVLYNIRWPVTRPNGSASYQLSSDNYVQTGSNAGYSGHAGYIYGWDDATMATLTNSCEIPSTDCHDQLLGNGTWLY